MNSLCVMRNSCAQNPLPDHDALRPSTTFGAANVLVLCLLLLLPLICSGSVQAAAVEEVLSGAPDYLPLTPHVVLPDSLKAAQLNWPLNCSLWPDSAPDEGFLASVFGHRIQGGSTDFHRGMDLRCELDGKTCCLPQNGDPMYCNQTTCNSGDKELAAPITALVAGEVHKVGDGSDNNNLVIKTELTGSDVIQVGNDTCDRLYIWYQHMRYPFAQAWTTNSGMPYSTVSQNEVLGSQGNSGANSVHLHLSVRACNNGRLDDQSPAGYQDPEINPFQLLGTDDGIAPTILSLDSVVTGGDVEVTVQIGTLDPDFDQLEIAVYDAVNDEHVVRRLGYNSRLGIDVINDIDSNTLEPMDLSELTSILEPDPPDPTSGLTLQATFPSLNLLPNTGSKVQIKVADVFGNTSIKEVPLLSPAILSTAIFNVEANSGLQTDASGQLERWMDLSGHGHDVVQADPNLRPDVTPDGVHFNTDSFMCAPHAADLNPDEFSVYMVFESLEERHYAGLMSTMNYAQRQGWNLALRSVNLQSDSFATSFQGNGASSYQGNAGYIQLATDHLISMTHNNPGTVVQLDATAPGSGSAQQLISYLPDTPLCFNVYYTDFTSQALRSNIKVKEVVLFDSALSPADDAEVAAFLKSKWGITP